MFAISRGTGVLWLWLLCRGKNLKKCMPMKWLFRPARLFRLWICRFTEGGHCVNEKQRLLQRVQMFDFILDELNLFLDTHPGDQNAIAYFNRYQYLKNAAANEYITQFGPLRAEDFAGGESFDWIQGPWPWEREGN